MLRVQKKVEGKEQPTRMVAQIDSTIETRSEMLLGKEYYVVPVVAMVEGVRTGANAQVPELGLADEFAADLITWANRPLVLNHPKVTVDGEEVYCSANFPEILNTYAFGVTMNPYLEDSKLKMEAWIDVQRVKDLGGEFDQILTAIQNMEPVEVSVGFFSQLEVSKGTFRGQSYGAIWRNIKPDHLAVLSLGVLGACSQADGCGIPRINQEALKVSEKPNIMDALRKVFKVNATTATTTPTTPTIKVDPVTQSGCGCGGEQHSCTCDDKAHAFHTQESLAEHLANEADRTDIRTLISGIVAQTIAPNIMNNDVRTLICTALKNKYPLQDVYLYGYTTEYAIFESYGYYSPDGYGYRTFQIGINVTENTCTFEGDAIPVMLMTKIVPQGVVPTMPEDSNITDPSATQVTQTTQENDMSVKATENPVTTEATQPAVQAQSPVVAPLTAQQYIDQAPAEIREMLQSSLSLHNSRKEALVTKIKANSANKFSEEQLRAFDLSMLENLASLAGEVVPNYGGVAAPVQPVNQSKEAEVVPMPPRLFSKSA